MNLFNNYLGEVEEFSIFLLLVLILASLYSEPLVNFIIGYVCTCTNTKKDALKISSAYACGFFVATIVVILLNINIRSEFLLTTNLNYKGIYIIFGVLMLLMALQILGINKFLPSKLLNHNVQNLKYIVAVIMGSITAICSNNVSSFFLMFTRDHRYIAIYSVLYSSIIIFIGTFFGIIKSFSVTAKSNGVKLIMKFGIGLVVLFMSIHMFGLGFKF